MTKVVSIYEAKTHLSQLIKKAQAGETIYIGAYGQPQAVIAPTPTKKPIRIGVLAHKYKPGDLKDKDIIGPDPDIETDFEKSIDRPLP